MVLPRYLMVPATDFSSPAWVLRFACLGARCGCDCGGSGSECAANIFAAFAAGASSVSGTSASLQREGIAIKRGYTHIKMSAQLLVESLEPNKSTSSMIMIYFNTGNDKNWVELMGILFCTQKGAPGARTRSSGCNGAQRPRAPGSPGPRDAGAPMARTSEGCPPLL